MRLVIVLAVLLLAPLAATQDHGGWRFGRAVCAVPDVDGDGLEDFVATAPFWGQGETRRGRVFVFSSRGPELRWSFDGPRSSEMLGRRVQSVRRDEEERTLLLASESEAGAVLCALDGELVHAFGKEVGEVFAAGDWDGDGYDDFAAERGERIVVISGRSFWVLHELPSELRPPLLGTAGDLDGDGRDEIVAGGGLQPSGARVHFGGGERRDLELHVPEDLLDLWSYREWALAPAGDFDGDHHRDLAIGWPRGDHGGCVEVFSGRDGRLLLDRRSDPQELAPAMFGCAVAGDVDLDGDGRPELVVGAPDGFFPPAAIYALRAGDARPLWKLEERNGERDGRQTAFAGASLAFVPDRDGDGVRELLVGGADVLPPHGGYWRCGHLRILSGATGEELWFFHGTQAREPAFPRSKGSGRASGGRSR